MGSAIPSNMGMTVNEHCPRVTVLDFYTSVEGEVILANVSGRSVGSMGRPLPGTDEVRVAAYDFAARTLALSDDGLGRECRVDEVGLLLSRVDPVEAAADGTM